MTLEERLQRHLGRTPDTAGAAFVAPDATVLGDVILGKESSVWYQCVLRADIEAIRIGEGTNIQDGTVIHLANDAGVEVGSHVTVGHRAILHACTVEDECLIGMGAVILDHARIGARSIIGANTLVPKGMTVPPGSMVYGSPARVVRPLNAGEQAGIRHWADKYKHVARAHAARA
jgi:carbonic anhydrase/acetyltransferase-like protein (isoleucine patch superfamily)